MFFQGWPTITNTIILSVLIYISIIIIVRVSGKRSLASFNAFDFLITVTIGSISASTMLSSQTKFFDGIAAIVTLIILQFIVATITAHSKTFRKIIKAEPTLLYFKGEYLTDNLRKMRISKDDVQQEVRIGAGKTIENIDAVILEANGKLSIVTSESKDDMAQMEEFK